MYYNARYYLPGIGKFASADTLIPDPANPQAFNRYSYVLNNPVKYTDPSGHCVFIPPYDTAVCIALLAFVLTGDTARPPRPPVDHANNTASLNVAAYTTISQRNEYYEWVQSSLTTNGSNSQWFAAADVVTNFNGVGAADSVLNSIMPDAADFLRNGNEFLFQYNMGNAQTLLNNGSLESFTDANGDMVSFNGLSGMGLDFALVQFEQTKVQEFINTYAGIHGGETTKSIIQNVNFLFSEVPDIFTNDLLDAVMTEFFDGGATFDFGNYDDRVLLGQELIRLLHENE